MNSIKEMMQELSSKGMPHICVGVVEELSPISISLKDDKKIKLSAISLVIPKRITNRRKCVAGHVCFEGCVGNCCEPDPMKVGDEFYMLAVNQGKLYYLLDWK